jgi:hypothetical protein
MQLQCVLDPAPGRRTALKQGLAFNDALELARQQWVCFDNALARLSGNGQGNGRHAAEVFTSSVNILQVMGRVTGLYGKLS